MNDIKADLRDITFNFEKSHNCCFGWMKIPLNPNVHVYINSHGIAERFDHTKVNNKRESLRRAVSNLNLVIEYNAHLSKIDPSQAHAQIVEAIGISLNEENPIPLTIGLILRINTAIYKIF